MHRMPRLVPEDFRLRMVNHLTVPPRSTWRVVELAGDGTPHDVPIEFPAQVVYIDNGSTANVQVRAPGDIAQSPPIAAGGHGSWLIPGATQLTVTGTGIGQVRLRFLNEAAARLLYTGGPGGSTASPVYAQLTGSLAPLLYLEENPVHNTTTTIAAGASYQSPYYDFTGYRKVITGINGAAGTSLSFEVWTYIGSNDGAFIASFDSANSGTQTSVYSVWTPFTTSSGPACWGQLNNLNSTDSMTFTEMEVIAQ